MIFILEKFYKKRNKNILINHNKYILTFKKMLRIYHKISSLKLFCLLRAKNNNL